MNSLKSSDSVTNCSHKAYGHVNSVLLSVPYGFDLWVTGKSQHFSLKVCTSIDLLAG